MLTRLADSADCLLSSVVSNWKNLVRILQGTELEWLLELDGKQVQRQSTEELLGLKF